MAVIKRRLVQRNEVLGSSPSLEVLGSSPILFVRWILKIAASVAFDELEKALEAVKVCPANFGRSNLFLSKEESGVR